MNILVFKTSVKDTFTVSAIRSTLDGFAGKGQWNFDLTDCDRVLRIASSQVKAKETIQLMEKMGIECAELED